VHGEALPTVDGNAVIDAETAGILERLLNGEAPLQMNVVVDHGNVLSAEPDYLAIHFVDLGAFGRERCGIVGQGVHANVLEVRGAARVVPLKRKGSVIEDALELGVGLKGRVGFDIVDNEHVVDPGLDLLAADENRYAEPFAILDEGLVDVADPIKGPGLFALDVTGGRRGIVVFHLHFESCRGKSRGLKGSMEINAGVGVGQGLDLGSQLEVPEIGAVDRPGIEEVRPLAVNHDLAVNHLEGALMLTGLPVLEGFAIEKGEPIG